MESSAKSAIIQRQILGQSMLSKVLRFIKVSSILEVLNIVVPPGDRVNVLVAQHQGEFDAEASQAIHRRFEIGFRVEKTAVKVHLEFVGAGGQVGGDELFRGLGIDIVEHDATGI